jgi:hypothetical protein
MFESGESEDEEPQYVVRAGMARPDNLIAGTTAHRLVPGLTGFSVQSALGLSVKELARGGQFRNGHISVTTVGALQRHGFEVVFPTPGRGGYHTTVLERLPIAWNQNVLPRIPRSRGSGEDRPPSSTTSCHKGAETVLFTVDVCTSDRESL